jgi:large subunit ribosomal protein L33
MAKKKDNVLVTLECTEAKAAGVPPSRYYTFKNKKKHPDKLEMRKYNKHLKKHTVHKEIK